MTGGAALSVLTRRVAGAASAICRPATLALGAALCLLAAPRGAAGNVTLIRFWAESDASSVTLNWETATELDTVGFRLRRAMTHSSSTSAGVPRPCNAWRANTLPATAATRPIIAPSSKVVPAMALTLCTSRAPHAWPMRSG